MGIGRSLLRLHTLFWDLRLGVYTRGRFRIIGTPEEYGYSTLSYKQIRVILNRLQIGPEDVFYDLGCGKGRVLCAVQVFKPKRVVGVEINRALAEIARGNLAGLRGQKCPFEIVNRPAGECLLEEGTVFYIYNPFGPKTLERVLLHLEASLIRNPRKIKIAYVNANFNALFEKSVWLIHLDTWDPCRKYPFIPYTTFWESKIFF